MKNLLASLMLTVALGVSAQTSTTTSLVADKQNSALGTIFTLTATVTDARGPVQLGRVTFYDGDPSGPAAALGTVVLNGANGTATLKRAFTIGSHAITAKFLGTNTEASSSSSSPTITVTGQYASTTALHNAIGGEKKLIAAVSGQGLVPITGSVTFTDTTTNTVLGTVPLNTPLLRTGFRRIGTVIMPDNSSPTIVVGDFNNDGKPDLVAITYLSRAIQVFLGHGNGSFEEPKIVSLPPESDPSLDSYPTAITVGDINGDGKQDLLVVGWNVTNYSAAGPGAVYTFLGHGDGSFAPPQTTPVGYWPYYIALGDLNGDGKLDAAVFNEFGDFNYAAQPTIRTLLGHGDGTFEIAQTLLEGSVSGGQSYLTQFLIDDFNGDGKADMAVANGGMRLSLGHGNGTFAREDTSMYNNPYVRNFVSGDFNNDGKLDLATCGDPGYHDFNVMLGHGEGTFERIYPPYQLAGYVNGITAGDFNNDGKLDVIELDYSRLFVLLGHNSGTFLQERPFYLAAQNISAIPMQAITGDFNGDGVPGLAVAVASIPKLPAGGTQFYIAILRNFSSSSSSAGAGLTGFTLTGAGPHTIKATYSGDSNFTGSTGEVVTLP